MADLVEQVKSISLNDSRQQHIDGHLKGTLTFDQLESLDGKGIKIPQDILRSLLGGELNFIKPSKIQEESIPRILGGRDLIAQAQPGAGKTVAFAIGMILQVDVNINAAQAICLTPTRELAVQIAIDALQRLMSAYPSTSKKPTIRLALKEDRDANIADHLKDLILPRGRNDKCVHQIIVGTPGTIATWAGVTSKGSFKQNGREFLNLSEVKIFVVDEADSMIGDGSKSSNDGLVSKTCDIKEYILHNSKYSCQYLFFSATFTDNVIRFGKKLLHDRSSVVVIKLDTVEALVLENIKQYRLDVRQIEKSAHQNLKINKNNDNVFDLKLDVLKAIYKINLRKTIIFCRTKDQADKIERTLTELNLTCSVLHGDKTGEERDLRMNEFRNNGDVKVLITTDVLARGVDVPAVSAVINFELPVIYNNNNNNIADPISYIHRIGRCSRFGTRGIAINLIYGEEDEKLMFPIEAHYKYTIDNRMTEQWDISYEKMSLDRSMQGLNEEIITFNDKKVTKIAEVALIEVKLDELLKDDIEEKEEEIMEKKNDEKTI